MHEQAVRAHVWRPEVAICEVEMQRPATIARKVRVVLIKSCLSSTLDGRA